MPQCKSSSCSSFRFILFDTGGGGEKVLHLACGAIKVFLLLSVSVLSASWIQIGVFVVFYFSVHIGFCSRSHSGLEFRIDNAA